MFNISRRFVNYLIPMPDFYVRRFGYEIEGGFNVELGGYNEDRDGYNSPYFKEDGSVECEDYVGEIASPVFYADNEGLTNMDTFVKRHMPDEVNETCGHHIHISPNNDLAYSKLMDKDFYFKFRIAVKALFKNNPILCHDDYLIERFEDRIYGREYCYNVFSPNSQAVPNMYSFDGAEQGRYTQMNYPYNIHSTVECRVFPACDEPEQVILINRWFINFVNQYLKRQTYERYNYDKMTLDSNHNEIIEDKILCV